MYTFVERFHLQNTPEISHEDAWFYFLINMMTGGIGTMIAGLHAKKFKFPIDGEKEKTGEYADIYIIRMGMIQCLTAPFFVGWLWGLLYMWGVVQYCKENDQKTQETEIHNETNKGIKSLFKNFEVNHQINKLKHEIYKKCEEMR